MWWICPGCCTSSIVSSTPKFCANTAAKTLYSSVHALQIDRRLRPRHRLSIGTLHAFDPAEPTLVYRSKGVGCAHVNVKSSRNTKNSKLSWPYVFAHHIRFDYPLYHWSLMFCKCDMEVFKSFFDTLKPSAFAFRSQPALSKLTVYSHIQMQRFSTQSMRRGT